MTRLLNLFRRRRDRLERDLDRELRYHVDRRVEDLIKDGLSEPEARRQASLELGGVPQVQEAVRDTWIWRWLDALVRDVRYAIRSLTRSWGFALGAGAVLALAIGANVAIFSVVNTVLLQPLAYPDADRIVSIETLWTNTGRASQGVSGPDFLDWQAQNDVFEKMAVYYSGDTGGTDDSPVILGDRATFANPRYVSADFFAVFGQTASAGRLLTEGDVPGGRGEPPVAVVRYQWAVTHFGSAEAAIGKRLTVNGGPLEIVGVAAPGFRYPGATDLWAPLAPDGGPHDRGNHDYHAVGKLKAGADLRRAQAQMRTIGDALARQYPENRLKTVSLIPLQERLTGNLQATLWVLMGAVGVVWLIGCANIANLLLARAASRTREIALRAALGAGRGRVVRQLLTENCVLARRGRAGGPPARVDARPGSGGVGTRRPAPDRRCADGPDRRALRTRTLAGIDGDLRPRAGAACLATRPVGWVETGRFEGDGLESQHSAPLGDGRRRSGVVGHPPGGRGAAAAIVPDAPARGPRVHHGSCAGGLHGVHGEGGRGGYTGPEQVLCRCARPSACRARGQCRVGRGLPGDGTGAKAASRLFHRRPTGGTTGGAAASRNARDHGGLLQDAGDSGPCGARLRQDRHARSGRGSPSSTRPWRASPFQGSRPLDSVSG